MTERDTTPDDDRDQPEEVGGFKFGMTDGGEEQPPTRADGAGAGRSAGFDFQEWLGVSLSDLADRTSEPEETEAADTTSTAESVPAAESISFAGFDFGEWLGSTSAPTPDESPTEAVEAEETAEAATETVDASAFDGFDFGTWLDATEAEAVEAETTEAEAAAELGPTYSGFDFRRWMADDGETGPKKPPATPRVVGVTPEQAVPMRARLIGLLPFFGAPDEVDTYPGGFDFADWLGEGEGSAEILEPIDVEPEPEPVEAGATIEQPEYPTPPGGGIADTPPIKVAAFALFAASLVAVGLTMTGAIGALGPASGFGSPPVSDETGEQPVATATPTPEPTPDPAGDSTPEPTETATATPTPTPAPTATPTATPTPTPSPTATPESTATATPTPTPENGSALDPITDPIFGE